MMLRAKTINPHLFPFLPSPLTFSFHTPRQAFHTNSLPVSLFVSKLFAIFAPQKQYKCNTTLRIMSVTTERRATSFRLPTFLLESLKTEAHKQHRSVNNLVEVVLLNALYNEPNAETLAAMAECESGVELDELTDENIENLEEYINTL